MPSSLSAGVTNNAHNARLQPHLDDVHQIRLGDVVGQDLALALEPQLHVGAGCGLVCVRACVCEGEGECQISTLL